MTVLEICLLQWNANNKRMMKVLETMSIEKYNTPLIQGGNTPGWILGHLVDTDDALLPLLGIGERKFPALENIYHHTRGANYQGHLTQQELLEKWKVISEELDKAFTRWSEGDWLAKHTAVNEDDFKKEPQRNRLNVMLSRVTHKASHLGQIAMIK